MEYSFTASVENEFDEIAEGKKVWNDMIESFYKNFIVKLSPLSILLKRLLGRES